MNKFFHTLIVFATMLLVMAGCNRPLEVGDRYRHDGIEGIVVQLDTLGQPLLLLSMEEAKALDYDSALSWAESLNTSSDSPRWVLPDNEQLSIVAQHKAQINTALADRGESAVLANRTWYWSSTVCSDPLCPTCPVTHAFAYGPDGLRCYYRENHTGLYRARAVMQLQLSK